MPELVADDACGHRNIERFGTAAVCGIGRDEEFAGYVFRACGRDAVPFIPHEDDPIRCELCPAECLSLEERAVDRHAERCCMAEKSRQVGVVYPYAENCPHGSLHDFGVEAVGRRS